MYRFKVGINEDEYFEFYKNYSKAPIMQDYRWKDIKNNWGSSLCGLYKDNKLAATALILKKKLFFNIYLFYIPRGYLIDFSDKELLKEFTMHIKEYAKKSRACYVKIDPYIAITETRRKPLGNESYQFYSKDSDIAINNLNELGYVHRGYKKLIGVYSQPRFTMAVPLVDPDGNFLSEDVFLRTLKKNVRGYLGDYHDKRGVTFTHSNDIKDVGEFIKIINKTEKRQNVSLRNKSYFERIMNIFKEDAVLFFGKIDVDKYLDFINKSIEEDSNNKDFLLDQKNQAEKLKEERGSNIIVSASLVLFPSNEKGIKMAEFLYAGNDTSVLPNLKVNNGLTYYRLLYCLNNGYHYANLGGVDGSLKDHLSIFKSKFNPLVLEFIGEYDLPVNRMLYKIVSSLETVVKKTFKLLRKIFKK